MQVDVDIMGSQNSMRQDYIEMQQRAFPGLSMELTVHRMAPSCSRCAQTL